MVAPCFLGLLGCRRPLSVRPFLLAMGHPCLYTAQDFDMVAEPRMSVLPSSPLRCRHSVTNRRRGSLGTDFSAACAPDSLATYVLVLGLPSGSLVPCGISVGEGGVFGCACLARHFPLSVLAGLVPPCPGSRVQAWSKPLLCYNVSGVSPHTPTYLLCVCMNTLSLRRGRRRREFRRRGGRLHSWEDKERTNPTETSKKVVSRPRISKPSSNSGKLNVVCSDVHETCAFIRQLFDIYNFG